MVVLWRRLDLPGHESARLWLQQSGWHLSGTSVFEYRRQPCRLDYEVVCDLSWRTLSGKIVGWVATKQIETQISVEPESRWLLDGRECISVEGCTDVDLEFSPSTNLLPIRRLNLRHGEAAAVRTAWLRFPGFGLEPLDQVYRRIDEGTYRYESGGGSFAADLEVNAAGFVTSYPGFWRLEGLA